MSNRIRRAVRRLPLVISMAAALLVGGQLQAADPSKTKQVKGLEQIYQDYGVSAAVRAGDFLFLGGITSLGSDGKVIGPWDGKKQIDLCYKRIEELLKHYGAGPKNVVSETIYHTGWNFMQADARMAFYEGVAFPNAAGVEVVSLADPALVFEIELIVYLGD